MMAIGITSTIHWLLWGGGLTAEGKHENAHGQHISMADGISSSLSSYFLDPIEQTEIGRFMGFLIQILNDI